MKFYTIGAFNSTEEEFFKKLVDNQIDVFCDIRQRRGVRGAKYSFVNANSLQESLAKLKIRYRYEKGLAPNTEIRDIQKTIDNINNTQKRKRKELNHAFINCYNDYIIQNFNFTQFLQSLNDMQGSHVVLFCVEEHSNACHRSIVAGHLIKRSYDIIHL